MPAGACPGTVQMYVFEPLASVTRRVFVAPLGISGVFLPAILKSCGTLPLFVTLKMTRPCGAVFLDRVNLNSFADTVTVVACVAAGLEIAAGASARPIAVTSRASESVRSFIQRSFLGLELTGLGSPFEPRP